MFCLNLLFCLLAFPCFKVFQFLLFSLPYFIMSSSIIQLYTYKSPELLSLPLYSNFMLVKFLINTITDTTIHTLFIISLYLSIYIF